VCAIRAYPWLAIPPAQVKDILVDGPQVGRLMLVRAAAVPDDLLIDVTVGPENPTEGVYETTLKRTRLMDVENAARGFDHPSTCV
jgi:hypothetical protein